MIEARNRAERFPLCAFAATGRTKEEEGPVSVHEQGQLYRKRGNVNNRGIRRSPTGISLPGWYRIDVHPAPRTIEPHIAINQGENGVVATQADVFAWQVFGAALANDDIAGDDSFAS